MKRNQRPDKSLIRQCRRSVLHRDAGRIEIGRESIEGSGIGDLPPEIALRACFIIRDDPLAAIIHPECAAGPTSVHRLQAELPGREVGPRVQVGSIHPDAAKRLNHQAYLPNRNCIVAI